MRRVVITGLGTVNPLGNNVKDTWEKIKRGEIGLDYITKIDTSEYKCKIAGEVKNFNPLESMSKKEVKRMALFSQYAIAAGVEAWNDSGLSINDIDVSRAGTYISSGVGGLSDCEGEIRKLLISGPKKVSSLFIPMMIGNIAAGNVAIKLGLRGSCLDFASACASSNNSLGEAFYAIRGNRADIIVTGGTESSLGELGISGFMNLRATSTTKDIKKASIPFDVERSGFVMGEGSAVLVLEELEHAKSRNAKIYGEIVGYGTTCDAYHITAPREDGLAAVKAMKIALDVAGIDASEVDYINAHGTSTTINDPVETKVIKNALGEDNARKTPVSSTKSMTGHLLGAAGAIEGIFCLKALEDGFIPPTAGLENPDPLCDLDYVPKVGRKKDITYAMSNALGFGGHNACVIFKKWEGR